MSDSTCSERNALSKISLIWEEFNKILLIDGLILIKSRDNQVKIEKINDELIWIASGGFADVFRIKSQSLVLKKLQNESMVKDSIRKRFKREFDITKSLANLDGIIRVYQYDESACSYTMEEADFTLGDYIKNQDLNETEKINIIYKILWIMSEVHKKEIVHRDISPNNIFLVNSQIKIADFGLGKNLAIYNSYNTEQTNQYGTFGYCSPEQLNNLKEATKRDDVYALGKLINFILTKNYNNDDHKFWYLFNKATSKDPTKRYIDAEVFF